MFRRRETHSGIKKTCLRCSQTWWEPPEQRHKCNPVDVAKVEARMLAAGYRRVTPTLWAPPPDRGYVTTGSGPEDALGFALELAKRRRRAFEDWFLAEFPRGRIGGRRG